MTTYALLIKQTLVMKLKWNDTQLTVGAMIAVLGLGMALQAIGNSDPVTELFQKGLIQEETQRDLSAAIQTYEEVLKRIDSQRRVAATTLFRLGESYRKLQRTNDAVRLFNRLIREFPEETTLVDLGRQNLVSLGAKPTSSAESTPAELDEEGRELVRLRTLAKTSPDLLDAPSAGLGGGVMTPLQQAAMNGWPRVIDFLLSAGVSRDNVANQEFAPFHYAVMMGHKTAAERLLQAGCSVNLTNARGMTPLHLAVGRGRKQIARWLLEAGAEINPVLSSMANTRDFNSAAGITPLGIAILNHWEPGVELLLEWKASVTAGGPASSPIEIAASARMPEVITKLFAAGADPKATYSDSLYSLALRSGEQNQTRLPQTLRTLKQAGAPLPSSIAVSLLEAAVEKLDAPTVEALLELGASPKLMPRENGYPLLITAVNVGSSREFAKDPRQAAAKERIVKALLKAGADPNVVSMERVSSLNLAVQMRSAPLVTVLLQAGANPNYASQDRLLPLVDAVSAGTNLMTLLLDAGADPNGMKMGLNPLLESVLQTALGPMELLLRRGANPNVRSGAGAFTALEKAHDMLQSSRNADPNFRSSPEMLSVLSNQVTLLIQYGAKEAVPDFFFIQARRGNKLRINLYTRPSTNDWNQYTLHDALANIYGIFETPKPASRFAASRRVAPPTRPVVSFTWPVLDAITVERFGSDANKTVLMTGMTNLVLQWGDVIEIPEAPHPLDASWGGLTPEQIDQIRRSLQGPIQISVGGSNLSLDLQGQQRRSFGLEDLLADTKLLKSTSDLTRVQVIRPASSVPGGGNRTWIVNLKEPGDWPDLWLRAGDAVVVDNLPSVLSW